VHEAAATEVFERDCLVRLGAVLAPVGAGKPGQPCVTIELMVPEQPARTVRVPFGEMVLLPLPRSGVARLNAVPERGFDLGLGRGRPLGAQLHGGTVGLIVDTRGRQPFQLPTDPAARIEKLRQWNRALQTYPREV
jgi:hypothetical protein